MQYFQVARMLLCQIVCNFASAIGAVIVHDKDT
jgi:hypothetical protein